MATPLVDLEARWVGLGEPGFGQILEGVSFLCPHCRTRRLAVLFVNAIDPAGWLVKGVTRHHQDREWTRQGETLETLTLTPSVDFDSVLKDSTRPELGKFGHWHGHITNGMAI